MNATTVAVDLAKSVFQLAVADEHWRQVETHRLTRTQFERWFANRDVAQVIMEACGSAHHWARWLNSQGIEVKLLPAQYVRAYVKRNKTDAADAAALLEAARASDIRPVRVKSVEQQALQGMHRIRSLWMGTRTSRINDLRGFCREFGIAIPVGARTGIEGFVSADVKARGSSSLQVFNMLAALIAPGMSVCVDAEDLRPVFGTAEQPSLIVNGVWLPGLEVFEVVTHEDRQLLKASSRVAYMPSTPLTISSQTKLLKAIRKSASDDTELVMMGPYGMLAESIQADRVVSVQLIAVSIPLAGSTPGISQTSKVIG